MLVYQRNPVLSVRTIGERVYQILRKNIIDLDLIPGQVLNMKDIAEELHVSRSPVRDAILKLNEEGLVDCIPQKGTTVSRIDMGRVQEERFIRHSLEEKVLRICLRRDMEPYQERFNEILNRQKRYIHTDRYREFLDYDDLFHQVFFQAAEKEFSWGIIQYAAGHYRRIRLMSLWNETITENVYLQHTEMLRALRSREIDRLLELFKEHCYKLRREKIDMMKQYPDYFSGL